MCTCVCVKRPYTLVLSDVLTNILYVNFRGYNTYKNMPISNDRNILYILFFLMIDDINNTSKYMHIIYTNKDNTKTFHF